MEMLYLNLLWGTRKQVTEALSRSFPYNLKCPLSVETAVSWSVMPRHGHYLFWFTGWSCFDISIGSLSFLSSCPRLWLKVDQISHKQKGTVWLSLHVCVGAKLYPEVWGCPKLLLNPCLHHPSEKVSVLSPLDVRRALLSMQGVWWAGNNCNTALMKKDTKDILRKGKQPEMGCETQYRQRGK